MGLPGLEGEDAMNVLTRGKVVLKETCPRHPRPRRSGSSKTFTRSAGQPANGADLTGLQVRRPTPEEIYLSLTRTRKEASR